MDVTVLDNDVVEIHYCPECDPFFLRCPGIAFNHASLHCNRTGDGLDHTGELDQNAIAGRLDDAAAMLASFGVDQLAPISLHPRAGAFLVGAHKPAVPRDVRGRMAASLRSTRSVAKAVLPEPHAAELLIGGHAYSNPKGRGLGIPFR
jgi:hypothetical protein